MPISDGYGEDRRDIDYEEYLTDVERLIKLKVAERLRGSELARDVWDDCLNEARITAWQVLQKRPDAPPQYVSAAMSNRIKEVIIRGTWFGMERTHGKPLDPLRRRDRDSVDDETLQLDQVVEAAGVLDQVILAYHHGEIHQALAALTFTQAQYVIGRFWYGMSNQELAALQGCSVQTVERHWRTEIRPQLVEHLQHLASA